MHRNLLSEILRMIIPKDPLSAKRLANSIMQGLFFGKRRGLQLKFCVRQGCREFHFGIAHMNYSTNQAAHQWGLTLAGVRIPLMNFPFDCSSSHEHEVGYYHPAPPIPLVSPNLQNVQR